MLYLIIVLLILSIIILLYKCDSISEYFSFDESTKSHNKLRIKCINLERRPDRKKAVLKLLDQHNLSKYCDFNKAVDGQKLKPTDNLRKLFVDNDFGSKKGAIGCALSHLELWNQLLADTKYDKYLILEDDIRLNPDFITKFNAIQNLIKNINWDIIYLGFHVKVSHRRAYREKLQNINKQTILPYDISYSTGGAFGYIINKSGARKLVEFIKKNGIKQQIDVVMYNNNKLTKLNSYELAPPIIFSTNGSILNRVDSDIQYDQHRLF